MTYTTSISFNKNCCFKLLFYNFGCVTLSSFGKELAMWLCLVAGTTCCLNHKAMISEIKKNVVITVQLKGNLIPSRVLQVENSWVKITSCVQYLNGRLLHLCPHQRNR